MRFFLLLMVLVMPAYGQNNTSPAPNAFTKQPIIIKPVIELPATGDKAFGAFQRGFYLTAFKEAVIEIEQKQSPAAMTLLAELYSGGLGVAQDNAKAKTWYMAASKKEDRNAIYALGLFALKGIEQDKNKDQAFDYFQKAAYLGHLAAIYNLGLIYMEREEDLKAYEQFEKAARAGLSDAQYALAQFIINGRGRDKNAEESVFWLERAAKQNLTEAEIEYGLALFNGKGIVKNQTEGLSYLRRAALKGNAIAQNRYARALSAGVGVKADPIEAARWHAIATLQGISDTWLDDQTAKLSEKDRRQATAIALRWYNFTNQ